MRVSSPFVVRPSVVGALVLVAGWSVVRLGSCVRPQPFL